MSEEQDPNENVDTGILSAEVEHVYAPLAALPSSLHKVFPNGAAVVFADEELVAAIPASEEQADQLADLMEQATISWPVGPDDLLPYKKLRDELCSPYHYVQLTAMFKREMDIEQNRETKLASAARYN
jgi:hypothetical protein